MGMLKITQDQQRFEISQIEKHIAQYQDLDIVEIEKQKLERLIYFAKKALGRYAPNAQKSFEEDLALNDTGKI